MTDLNCGQTQHFTIVASPTLRQIGFFDLSQNGSRLIRRRFPPPWCVEELDDCYVVKDRDGQKLAYVYFEDEP
jgi:hypothetical protein